MDTSVKCVTLLPTAHVGRLLFLSWAGERHRVVGHVHICILHIFQAEYSDIPTAGCSDLSPVRSLDVRPYRIDQCPVALHCLLSHNVPRVEQDSAHHIQGCWYAQDKCRSGYSFVGTSVVATRTHDALCFDSSASQQSFSNCTVAATESAALKHNVMAACYVYLCPQLGPVGLPRPMLLHDATESIYGQ
jgi:hypothetical protein